MDIMRHGHDLFRPKGTRTPGGADYPLFTNDMFVLVDLLPSVTRSSTVVGVVDTGLVLDDVTHMPHPWIGNRASCTEEERDRLEVGHRDRHQPGYLADADGHGTFVTGLILNEARTARVIMRGVLDRADETRLALDADDDANVARAVSELAENSDVKVINLSFAGGAFAEKPENLYEVIQAIHQRVAVVAAAGNDASDAPVWPAAYPEVISVGAVDERNLISPEGTPRLANFSNCGDWVDAYAGGVEVLGPFVNFDETKAGYDTYGIRPPRHFRGWTRWSGTSFASAIVSGRIAQMAIEKPELSGADAATAVLKGSPYIFGNRARWVRSANPPA
jgi:subtilisin family serine protease